MILSPLRALFPTRPRCGWCEARLPVGRLFCSREHQGHWEARCIEENLFRERGKDHR